MVMRAWKMLAVRRTRKKCELFKAETSHALSTSHVVPRPESMHSDVADCTTDRSSNLKKTLLAERERSHLSNLEDDAPPLGTNDLGMVHSLHRCRDVCLLSRWQELAQSAYELLREACHSPIEAVKGNASCVGLFALARRERAVANFPKDFWVHVRLMSLSPLRATFTRMRVDRRAEDPSSGEAAQARTLVASMKDDHRLGGLENFDGGRRVVAALVGPGEHSNRH